jgi:hypothetical protein
VDPLSFLAKLRQRPDKAGANGVMASRMIQDSRNRNAMRISAMSALPRIADPSQTSRHVGDVPILLQKSFWGDERKFLEPLMRFAHGDVRDHIVSSKIDHGSP